MCLREGVKEGGRGRERGGGGREKATGEVSGRMVDFI